MKQNAPPGFFVCLACLLGLSSRSSAGTWIAVLPVEYRGGPIPVPYESQIYTAYASTPGSIQAISDSSLDTFTQLQGLDNVVQSNGVNADTGTFYLLGYEIDPQAEAFHIEFTARATSTASDIINQFAIIGLTPSGSSSPGFKFAMAPNVTTFGMEFTRNGNDGERPLNWGLNSMMGSGGRIWLALQGGDYIARINQEGTVQTWLYEVRASYFIPEPGTWGLVCIAGCLLPGRRRTLAKRPRESPRD